MSKYGLDISMNGVKDRTFADEYLRVNTAYGGRGLGPHMKFFDGGNGWQACDKQVDQMGWGRFSNEIKPVFCAKRHDATAFNNLMDHRASVSPIWCCYWQEVNDDLRDGHLSVKQYRDTFTDMDRLRKAHPNGSRVRLVPIMNAWVVEDSGAASAVKGGWDTVSLLKGLTIDAVGYDLYDDSWMGKWSPDTHLKPAADAAKALGNIPWCIPEFGIQRSTKAADTDQTMADRLQAVITYCNADPKFKWLNYWEGKGENGDWSLIGTPAQAVMRRALAV